MANLNVRKGDKVLVIAGKDKGKSGMVIATSPKNETVTVEGINLVMKCVKARGARQKSGIVQQPAAIAVSNVMPICPTCNQATRVKHSEVDGKKVRVCKCGAVLVYTAAKRTRVERKRRSKKAEE